MHPFKCLKYTIPLLPEFGSLSSTIYWAHSAKHALLRVTLDEQ